MAFENPSPVAESTLELRLATTTTGGVSLAIWIAVVARGINLVAQSSHWHSARGTFSTPSQLTKESAASLGNVSVNKVAGGIEIRDEEAINSTLPELTRAAKTAEHLLFERLSDTGLAKFTVTVESSPSNDSLNGGSQVTQAVSQVIVPLVVWICVAGELKRLTAVAVPWVVHVSEQTKGSKCHT
jgi:hypothetical protein